MKTIPVNERIILALDVEDPARARELVRRTEPACGFYKVGLQLFLAGGFAVVDWLTDRGHRVMLDLKFHDIPETVRLAMEQLHGRGIDFATVHGLEPVLRAAVAGRGDVRILAVTVLTSTGAQEVSELSAFDGVEDLVLHRAGLAAKLGCDGVVASGLEAARLRRELGEELLIVCPGIRPAPEAVAGGDDQHRVMTPGRAVAAGADHLVVGRPVTRAAEPLAVLEAIQQEIDSAA